MTSWNRAQITASLKLWRTRKNRQQEKLNKARKNRNNKWEGIYKARLRQAVEMVHLREKQLQAYNSKHKLTWMPGAVRHPLHDAGDFAPGFRPRGVLHTTESHGDATETLRAKDAAPHFEVTEQGTIIQYIGLDRAARALKRPFGVETNRAHAIQIEISGFARQGGKIDDNSDQARALRRLMRFIEANAGVANVSHVKFPDNGQGVRLSEGRWANLTGWCGHMHVPNNDHWDPGGIEISKFL